MSKVYIMDLVGIGIFAVPATAVTLGTCSAGLDNLLSVEPAVPDLTYTTCNAFVRQVNGVRTLNCILDGVSYLGAVPSEANTDAMFLAIETALKYNPGGEIAGLITSVGTQRANLWAEDPQ